MCVLTYVPLPSKGFIVTSNRDENISRPRAIAPKKLKINGLEVFCPIDPISNGTWIATSKNSTLVLLNGGTKNHVKKTEYQQSRGRVIMEYTRWNNPEVFFENFDFSGMEPFTFVIFDNHNREDIFEIIWCEDKKYFKKLKKEQPLIWSSATLYDTDAAEKRKQWFFDHLINMESDFSTGYILDFHYNGGQQDSENSINLKRQNGIQTVCITQIDVQPNSITLNYNDLVSRTNKRLIIF